ncbi:hypothetical protein CYMTET_17089 [Cymbomonas tetramitiformis]|uniref:Uncharacterized protein n=1 Tax=Cymbomonas tetramitiformis TaxID=36881 RepID=A0AAE0GAT1_9CHLO|nr:hypothetical protein CYMTET_17089 [Cymbomonas tetramitiformis]
MFPGHNWPQTGAAQQNTQGQSLWPNAQASLAQHFVPQSKTPQQLLSQQQGWAQPGWPLQKQHQPQRAEQSLERLLQQQQQQHHQPQQLQQSLEQLLQQAQQQQQQQEQHQPQKLQQSVEQMLLHKYENQQQQYKADQPWSQQQSGGTSQHDLLQQRQQQTEEQFLWQQQQQQQLQQQVPWRQGEVTPQEPFMLQQHLQQQQRQPVLPQRQQGKEDSQLPSQKQLAEKLLQEQQQKQEVARQMLVLQQQQEQQRLLEDQEKQNRSLLEHLTQQPKLGGEWAPAFQQQSQAGVETLHQNQQQLLRQQEEEESQQVLRRQEEELEAMHEKLLRKQEQELNLLEQQQKVQQQKEALQAQLQQLKEFEEQHDRQLLLQQEQLHQQQQELLREQMQEQEQQRQQQQQLFQQQLLSQQQEMMRMREQQQQEQQQQRMPWPDLLQKQQRLLQQQRVQQQEAENAQKAAQAKVLQQQQQQVQRQLQLQQEQHRRVLQKRSDLEQLLRTRHQPPSLQQMQRQRPQEQREQQQQQAQRTPDPQRRHFGIGVQGDDRPSVQVPSHPSAAASKVSLGQHEKPGGAWVQPPQQRQPQDRPQQHPAPRSQPGQQRPPPLQKPSLATPTATSKLAQQTREMMQQKFQGFKSGGGRGAALQQGKPGAARTQARVSGLHRGETVDDDLQQGAAGRKAAAQPGANLVHGKAGVTTPGTREGLMHPSLRVSPGEHVQRQRTEHPPGRCEDQRVGPAQPQMAARGQKRARMTEPEPPEARPAKFGAVIAEQESRPSVSSAVSPAAVHTPESLAPKAAEQKPTGASPLEGQGVPAAQQAPPSTSSIEANLEVRVADSDARHPFLHDESAAGRSAPATRSGAEMRTGEGGALSPPQVGADTESGLQVPLEGGEEGGTREDEESESEARPMSQVRCEASQADPSVEVKQPHLVKRRSARLQPEKTSAEAEMVEAKSPPATRQSSQLQRGRYQATAAPKEPADMRARPGVRRSGRLQQADVSAVGAALAAPATRQSSQARPAGVADTLQEPRKRVTPGIAARTEAQVSAGVVAVDSASSAALLYANSKAALQEEEEAAGPQEEEEAAGPQEEEEAAGPRAAKGGRQGTCEMSGPGKEPLVVEPARAGVSAGRGGHGSHAKARGSGGAGRVPGRRHRWRLVTEGGSDLATRDARRSTRGNRRHSSGVSAEGAVRRSALQRAMQGRRAKGQVRISAQGDTTHRSGPFRARRLLWVKRGGREGRGLGGFQEEAQRAHDRAVAEQRAALTSAQQRRQRSEKAMGESQKEQAQAMAMMTEARAWRMLEVTSAADITRAQLKWVVDVLKPEEAEHCPEHAELVRRRSACPPTHVVGIVISTAPHQSL